MLRNSTRPALAILAILATACSGDPQQRAAVHMESGRKHMANQDWARASIEFRNAVKLQPKSHDAIFHLGLANLEQGNIQEGVNALRRTILLKPDHAEAKLRLASLELRSRDGAAIKDAEKQAREVVTKDPGSAQGSLVLATAEFRLGKVEEGMKRLEETVARFPGHLNSAVMLARHRIAIRDFAEAERILERAAAEASNSAEPRIALGHFHGALGQYEQAAGNFSKALAIDAANGRAMAGLASVQIARQQLDEAAATLRRLSALPGKEFKPYYAMFLYQSGKREQAIAEFARLYQADPQDRNARTQLVAAYIETRNLRQAHQLLADALEKDPRDMLALEFRARVLLLENNPERAQADVRAMLKLDAKSAVAHYLQAKVYQAKGAARSYQGELNEALTLLPTLLAARIELSQHLRQNGSAKSAFELLDKMPEEQKGALEAVIERNWIHLARGNELAAGNDIAAALKRLRHPEFLLQLAVLKLRTDASEARKYAQEALARSPEDPRIMSVIADSFAMQRQPDAAREAVKQIAARRPGSASLQQAAGLKLLRLGDPQSARAAFEAARKADPAFVPARLAIAELDVAENRLGPARQNLEDLLAADSANAGAHLLSGMLYEREGRKEQAIDHFRKAVEADPNHVIALNNLAFLLLEQNQNQEALKFAQRAKELAPASPAVDDTLGWVYFQLGVYPSAVKHLETAVNTESTAVRNYHLAMAYHKAGSASRASETLRTAVRMNPNLPEARLASELLGAATRQ